MGGVYMSSWAFQEFKNDNLKCFNYTNLSITWILIEIIIFILGILTLVIYFWIFKSSVEPVSQKKTKKKKQPLCYRSSQR